MRRKWERYGKRLQEDDGDGSLIGAPFIIAESGVTDVLALLAAVERVRLMEEENVKLRALVSEIDGRCTDVRDEHHLYAPDFAQGLEQAITTFREWEANRG